MFAKKPGILFLKYRFEIFQWKFITALSFFQILRVEKSTTPFFYKQSKM